MDDFRQQLRGVLGRLGHAYILSGPDRETLENAAAYLSAAYVCQGRGDRPCLSCNSCRKAMNGIHPDVITVMPAGKKGITVEQVREARREMYIRPGEAEQKVLILQQAQTLNSQGQNALLKTVEEGPDYAAFLFLVEDPEQLLPTIRSRCETVTLRQQEAGGEPDKRILLAGQKLARLLLAGDEMPLVEYTASLEQEKWNREDMQELMACLERQLLAEAPGNPARVTPILEQVKKMQYGLIANVGAGSLLGALAVSAAGNLT